MGYRQVNTFPILADGSIVQTAYTTMVEIVIDINYGRRTKNSPFSLKKKIIIVDEEV